MEVSKLVKKVVSLLYETPNSAGVTRNGMYNMDKYIFTICLEQYLKGENVIDEYDNLTYLKLELDNFFRGYILSKKQIYLAHKALNNRTFWNIHKILTPTEIERLKDYISYSIKQYLYINSKDAKRLEACLYTGKKEVRSLVFKRDGKSCKHCKTTRALTLDHIIPVSKGGKNEIKNLQVLCQSCNSKKSNKLTQNYNG